MSNHIERENPLEVDEPNFGLHTKKNVIGKSCQKQVEVE